MIGLGIPQSVHEVTATLTPPRYADDVSMNQEMREVERWNDPAAEFISVSRTSDLGFFSWLNLPTAVPCFS